MARRTKEEAAETRQRILDAALEVFSRKGYSRTTFADIARQIGLTKGAVYWHFNTKTDLLVALIEGSKLRKCTCVLSPSAADETIESLGRCYVESARRVLADPLLRRFEFFINFQIEWSEELMAEVRSGLSQSGEDPFRKYSVAIKGLQDSGWIDPEVDAQKMGAILIATWVGMMRLFMVGLVSEKDLIYQLKYSFDSMFRDISKKG